MIGPIVRQNGTPQQPETPSQTFPIRPSRPSDPLSEVLALMKPQVYASGGFSVLGDLAVHFPRHNGIKCYAMLAGECWLVVEGVPDPVSLHAGDCFLLPRGLPFRLATSLSIEPILYTEAFAKLGLQAGAPGLIEGAPYIAGGHFSLSGGPAEMILPSLPPIVHIRGESEKVAMRWCLERMRDELGHPRPGGSLITQQLAYMMLIQALRLYMADAAGAGPGWLAALSDRHMSIAIAAMHNDPGYPWTLQSLAERVGVSRSVFAARFRATVGVTPLDYLTRWRMLLAAERVSSSSDGIATIARSLGYESESAFSKAFRRIVGCSPRQYTRSHATSTVPTEQRAEPREPSLAAVE